MTDADPHPLEVVAPNKIAELLEAVSFRKVSPGIGPTWLMDSWQYRRWRRFGRDSLSAGPAAFPSI